MKLLTALLIILILSFLNWKYLPANPKAGISAWGMKTEIKQNVHQYVGQSDLPIECFEQFKVCDLR